MIEESQLAVLAALAPLVRDQSTSLLEDRWADLDRVDPIVHFKTQVVLEGMGYEHRDQWVPTHAITDVDGETLWGEVNNRYSTYGLNMTTLGECTTTEDFIDYLDDLCSIKLKAYPGPCGALFETAGDGRHRTHIIKALGMQRIWVKGVYSDAVADRRGDQACVFLWDYRSHVTPRLLSHGDMADPEAVARRRQERAILDRRYATELTERNSRTLAHLRRLELNGVITGVTVKQTSNARCASFSLTQDLPTYWALELPEDVSRLSRRYARSYPEFADSPDGAAMCDGARWLLRVAPIELPMDTEPARANPKGVVAPRSKTWRRWTRDSDSTEGSRCVVNSLKGVSSRRLRQEFIIRTHRDHLRLPSYFAASCGGAPLTIIKAYVEQQRRPV
jgi:hypothetical protein